MSTDELQYVYNNEAICAIAIYSILKECEYLEYSRVVLIPPIVFNNRLMSVFSGKSIVRGVEELLIKKGELLTNFNSQYVSFLPLTCNTLILLHELGFLLIEEKGVRLTKKEFKMKGLGKRADKIVKCAPKIAPLLIRESVEKIYLQLRVML
ncbi:MAG: three component ABC system middle component [Cellulosilyticaceae bacterium]